MRAINNNTRIIAKKPWGKRLKALAAMNQDVLHMPQINMPQQDVPAAKKVKVHLTKVPAEVLKANRVSAYTPLIS